MRVLFASTVHVGHLTPLLPYAQEFARRGHDVKFATRNLLARQIKGAGFSHHALGRPDMSDLGAFQARHGALPTVEANDATIKEFFGDIVARAALPKMQEVVREWRPDLIIRETVEYASLLVADAERIPHARVEVLNPMEETLVLHNAASVLDKLRQDVGLSGDSRIALLGEAAFSSFPDALADPEERFGAEVFRVAPPSGGIGTPPSDAPWLPPGEEPFVYVTLGTQIPRSDHVGYIYRVVLDALAASPVRALLTTGSTIGSDELGSIPQNVVVEKFVQQSEALPLASLMVCHGGSGTVLGGLAAGLPMVLMPLFADQPSNAAQIEAAGAGIAVMEPDADKLSSAIRRALTDEQLSARARKIASEMAALPDIDQAVDRMISLVASKDVNADAHLVAGRGG